MSAIKGIYFDFGYVIGYTKPDIDRKNLYLNWDGISDIVKDENLSQYFNKGIGVKELEDFFYARIYNSFIKHETSDLLDPQSYNLLLKDLHTIFNCVVDEKLVDNILYYINTMKYLDIYPGTADILHKLKDKHYCLSMISNMMLPGKLLIHKLQENNILQYFNTVSISSDVGFIKPRKEIFLKTLEKDSLKPEEVVFVGDTYAQDIIGAKKAGMKTVWLNCRHEAIEDKTFADYEIQNLEQLNKLF